jgi:DNA-binding MarR family transcriptional regulator
MKESPHHWSPTRYPLFEKSLGNRIAWKPSGFQNRETGDILALIWSLRNAARAYASVDRALGHRLGVSPRDAHALEIVFERVGVGPSKLARSLGIGTAACTELIDRLLAKGHLYRTHDHFDRRRFSLYLSLPTHRVMLETRTYLRGRLGAKATTFTPEERAAAGRFLNAAAVIWRTFEQMEKHRDDEVPSPSTTRRNVIT